MAKQRIHNEYFRTVSLGNRKSCPTCHSKLPGGESIWSWGEYIHGKWNTVTHFCVYCWDTGQGRWCPKQRLLDHSKPCGCTFELVGYGGAKLPVWLTLDDNA